LLETRFGQFVTPLMDN